MQEEGAMHVKDVKPALVSLVGAFAASLCCLLPLGVIVFGLGSGAFMATTMRYQSILLPLGLLGVTGGYVLYFRERRRCQQGLCTMARSQLNLVALGVATVVLLGEVVLVAFPAAASRVFTQVMVSTAKQVEHFEAEGTIVSVDHEKRFITIDHGDIKGFMAPMTMAFPAQSPALFTGIAPGDRVRFRLERSPQGLAVIALTKQEPAEEARVVLDVAGMT
jgi:Cu/Ag efflux protein CusF